MQRAHNQERKSPQMVTTHTNDRNSHMFHTGIPQGLNKYITYSGQGTYDIVARLLQQFALETLFSGQLLFEVLENRFRSSLQQSSSYAAQESKIRLRILTLINLPALSFPSSSFIRCTFFVPRIYHVAPPQHTAIIRVSVILVPHFYMPSSFIQHKHMVKSEMEVPFSPS
jgi:hypothetical protein